MPTDSINTHLVTVYIENLRVVYVPAASKPYITTHSIELNSNEWLANIWFSVKIQFATQHKHSAFCQFVRITPLRTWAQREVFNCQTAASQPASGSSVPLDLRGSSSSSCCLLHKVVFRVKWKIHSQLVWAKLSNQPFLSRFLSFEVWVTQITPREWFLSAAKWLSPRDNNQETSSTCLLHLDLNQNSSQDCHNPLNCSANEVSKTWLICKLNQTKHSHQIQSVFHLLDTWSSYSDLLIDWSINRFPLNFFPILNF